MLFCLPAVQLTPHIQLIVVSSPVRKQDDLLLATELCGHTHAQSESRQPQGLQRDHLHITESDGHQDPEEVRGELPNMADQNTKEDELKFYSEILSPSELFAARSRSHKIPVRGQKDFFPDDSDEQRQRLEQSLNEHWSLISEERVEKLGNLVKATWSPSEQIVELQSPAGKFWQTMGFSANGKQYLLPEEALYLMECGNVQVFYRGLPLSIQDGYERFLSSSTVSLQQYQVFGHLKRLGYVVHRFDPSSEPSSYARQLNLPQSRDRAGRQLKRKRSASPTPSTPTKASHSETQEKSTADRMEVSECGRENEEDKELPESQLTMSPETSGTQPATVSSADSGGGRTWWMTDDLRDRSDHQPASGTARWDFSSIAFPDLGSREQLSTCLASPDPSLLPGSLAVGVCDLAHWSQRINLRKVKMSPKEQNREEDRRRSRRDVNKDREVQQCRNWVEYRALLARQQRKREGRLAHLWDREVTPLHDPRQPVSHEELLEKISVIKSTNLLEGASRLKGSDEWRICFNVYQPDTVADFKKSKPGKPYSRMCVCSFDGPVPDLRAIKSLTFQSGDIPVVFAVVDYGDISFYTFKDFQLPTDVYP
ncbi:tRNA-splicing endonuclease subunit Sen54 [Plectropomus leopardus]|uniref:tRNA-splicing endonuclease subunit Sen54 n=1 Tax=Plectropomus leopardus TaxID=160734 RepID=UPI001C4CC562|nr:tRNA-splicing endonuclease subunit Sen54 [Plectropomus leopardus]